MKNPKCPKCGKGMKRNGHTPAGKTRWLCCTRQNETITVCYSTTNPKLSTRKRSANAVTRPIPVFKRRPGVTRFVVTAAQNATPVHAEFWGALQVFAAERNAQILVIPTRYKNPTSRWTASQENAETWAPEVTPYLVDQKVALNRNLRVMADLKIQPTAVRPLTGLEGFSHGESGIVGHPKVQVVTVPTPQNRMAKILATTGACTKPNYTDSRAGRGGEFHHQLGAVYVETQGSKFWLRHLTGGPTGAFYDIHPDGGVQGYLAQGTVWHKRPGAVAVVCGDLHVGATDPKVLRATHDLIAHTRAENVVLHDVFDAYSCTPHHAKNPFLRVAKTAAKKSSVQVEFERALACVRDFTERHKATTHVVPSNHDDMLMRWLMNTDWRTDPSNAAFYLQMATAVLARSKIGKSGFEYEDPFAAGVRSSTAAHALARGESLMLGGYECGMHGDAGPNGKRGTVGNLSRLGVRVISGHGHAPAVEEGHIRVGTMTPTVLEYTRGQPSSWLNAHAVVYPHGKATLVYVIDGKWHA